MGTRLRRRSFSPCLDGVRLEERVALSTATVALADSTTTASTVITSNPSLKSGYIQATGIQLHTAFQTFLNQVNKASQNAIKRVGNGQTEANALSSLQAYTSLEGGILESRVQQVSERLPNGAANLFDAIAANPPATSPPTVDQFVPMNQRLMFQIDNMITTLTMSPSNATLQGFNQNAALTIVSTYQGCKAAMGRYVNLSNQFGNFTVVPGA